MNNPGSEYDVTLRNVCGVLDDNAITQETATQTAKDEAIRQGFSAETIDTRKVIVFYYVTDPAHPVWKIFLGVTTWKGKR
jgi:hypothetical protein